MKVQPAYHVSFQEQYSYLDNKSWSVARLAQLAKDLKPFEVPVSALNMSFTTYNLTLRELAGQVLAVNNADMAHPIILDEDGSIMDGRHRIVRAIIEGRKSIWAVRFATNPEPCSTAPDE